ncbi:hypothetical protein [Marinoscillum sp.]|uniref:hypothetical protein n=1 Tax=Marinoscillum sp. TaxID=2024838 RepID=UPI003BAB112C
MNVTLTRYFYLSLIILFLTIIIGSIYYMLGGFDEVKVYRLDPIERTVAGQMFVSHYTDQAPIDFGTRCREMIANKDIDGTLTIITFHNDTLPKNQIARFIGISLAAEMSEIPESFEVRQFQSNARYAVFLSMHVLVQPRPHKIESMLHAKAQEEGDELEDFFMEIRFPDNSLIVEGWAR